MKDTIIGAICLIIAGILYLNHRKIEHWIYIRIYYGMKKLNKFLKAQKTK